MPMSRTQGRYGDGRVSTRRCHREAGGWGGRIAGVVLRRLWADDVYLVVDAPDHEAMAAVSVAVTSTGVLSNYQTIVLLTADQIDAAANMSVDYTPPGG